MIMKRFVALTLAVLIFAASFVSCSKQNPTDQTDNTDHTEPLTGLPEGMSGIDAIKLMLAGERLDSRQLKGSGNIFETGTQVLNGLVGKARTNLVNVSYSGGASLVPLSTTTPLSTKEPTGDGSYVEIEGDVYRWKGFKETSNSHEYFENITKNIIDSAERGAELIDEIKKNVRVVDKWVKVDEYHTYLLHVEDNMELLLSRYESDELWQTRACRRYKNSEGVNVYEIYTEESLGKSYMVYIPDKKCEYAFQHTNGFNHNFLAENTKGFWEVVDIGRMETHYNVSCMVLKDDICYDAFYDPSPDGQFISMIKVISADRKTDLLWYSGYSDGADISLQLQGFDGIAYLEAGGGVHTDTSGGGTVYTPIAPTYPTLVTENGTRINANDTFLEGKIHISAIRLSHYWYENGGSYVPTMDIRINSADLDETMDILKDFLTQVELSCRRDIEYVTAGILLAQQELSQFTKYHQWNESPITTNDTIAQGFINRDEKYKAWQAEFERFNDTEVLDIRDQEQMSLNMHFAPATAGTGANVTANGLTVTVSDFEVSVSDTLLFVENEPYVVNFALLGLDGTDGMLTHLNHSDLTATPYSDGDSFTVTANTTFELPLLAEGSYTLVAYISTEDGIRSSGYTPVSFQELTPYESELGYLAVRTAKASDGTLLLTFEEILDIEVTVAMPETGFHSYVTMFDALSEQAYVYGFAEEGAVVEKLGEDGNWTALIGTEETLESGTYRLKYSIQNGEKIKNGTVFTDYTAPQSETPA